VDEIAPGIHHWTAHHEGINRTVHSYCLVVDGSASLVDPMLPPEGVEAFTGELRPRRILLTNRHHLRHSERFVEEFGCEIPCHEAGLHEFEGGPAVQGFSFGDEVAPGVIALEVGAITPEETALHARPARAMALADVVVEIGNGLQFVPDILLGDDPEAERRAMRDSLRRLLEADFDHLLLAHGDPIVVDGKRALADFVGSTGTG
jgi:glyoxylase-like metal-dependent hydrolase (beta-lactamase superfamily II)